MAARNALRRWSRRFSTTKTPIGAQAESLSADPEQLSIRATYTARRNPLAVPTAIQERRPALTGPTVDPVSPLNDQETKKLLDRLTDVDESVAKTFSGLLRPKDGWWPVVAKTDDPAHSKVLSYMCQPTDALKHVVDTNFSFDFGDGAPYINGSSDRADGGPEYRAVGNQGVVPIAYFRNFGEGAPSDWTSVELAEDFRLFWLI